MTLVRAPIVFDLDDNRSQDAVRLLREEIVPLAFAGSSVPVFVTGLTAGSMDFTSQMLGNYIELYLIPVLGGRL